MTSLADVFELRFQGIALRFDQTWSLVAHIPHGAFLDHHPTGLTLHLRGWHRHGDAAWLRKELYAQNWKGPPVNVELRTVDGRNIIGGTFAFIEPGKLVREWFISDGKSGAIAQGVHSDLNSVRECARVYSMMQNGAECGVAGW